MKLIYIPLDERPCNYNFARRIADGTEVQVVAPALDLLGQKKVPADFKNIKNFILENVGGADACVISLDMLLYGGIIPSRLHCFTEEELCERLSLLDEIKGINPSIKIYAFALIMRCPKYSSSDEEPDYYEYCGREIFLTGQTKHKLQLGIIDRAEANDLISKCENAINGNLEDFESRRVINRNMLIKTVEKLHKSIDFLIIPQDDSAEYGYTSMDREAIKSELKRNGLDDVAMYPGADEVGMTLLARAACEYKGITPKIYCEFPHKDAPEITPLYEDRPLCQTLPFQISAAGCIEVKDKEKSDVHLYLNYPAFDPVEVWQEKSDGYGERNLEKFIIDIKGSIFHKKVTALADGAYCNGGDREFLQMLSKNIDLLDLSAYAGWNTSSNTLGTVICQAVFVFLFGNNSNQKRFLAERIYEDVGYCGYVRAYVTNNILADLGYNYFDAGERNGEVAKIVKQELEKYIDGSFPELSKKYDIARCQMPWKRMFEVDLALKEK